MLGCQGSLSLSLQHRGYQVTDGNAFPISPFSQDLIEMGVQIDTFEDLLGHTFPTPIGVIDVMGYHLREIKTKGVYGQVSKVYEELEEYEESMEQGNRIMAVLELSDAYGALEALALHHGFNMDDLRKMSSATKRAFTDGTRGPKNE